LDAVRDQLDAVSLSWNSCALILSNPNVHSISIHYIDPVLEADSPYPLFPSASSTPFPLYVHGVLWHCKASSFRGIGKWITE
jgi:hypothetical protein